VYTVYATAADPKKGSLGTIAPSEAELAISQAHSAKPSLP